MRHQLTRQAAAHSDHLSQVLKIQEQELHEKYRVMLQDEVLLERDRLRGELNSYIHRLRGIEAAIEGKEK